MSNPIHPIPPRRPNLLELADNFAGATSIWAKAGFPIADRDEYERRHEICKGCEMWSPNAFQGVGRCGACGCSGFKLWLETSHCPIGKWEEEAGQINANESEPESV